MRAIIPTTLIAMLGLLAGCGVERVPVQIAHPADTIDLAKAGVKRIAIGDLASNQPQQWNQNGQAANGAQDVGDTLREGLVKLGTFDILERSQIDALVKEHALDQSGLVDESTATQAGKFSGATALITGRIAKYDCTPRRSVQTVQVVGGGYSQMVTIDETAVVDVTFQIVDVESGKIEVTKKLGASLPYHADNHMSLGQEPQIPDASAMLAQCRNTVVEQFIHDIAPYNVSTALAFQTDDKLPQLTAGINSAKIGDWDEAIKSFQEATVAIPTSDKAHYDLGIAHQMTGHYDEAETELKAAYKINPTDDYAAAIKECQAERANAKKM